MSLWSNPVPRLDVTSLWEKKTWSSGDQGVQLDDPKLDARHPLVRPTSEGCMIYDFSSSNGTASNDVPLAGTPLNSGDVIKLSIAELEFIREEST